MISISFFTNDPNKISVYFEKESLKEKIAIMELIINIMSQHKKIEYYIMIRGLGATIESFLEKTRSNMYVFIDKYKYKFIVRELPELYLVTEHIDDFFKFTEFLESFNEGELCVHILTKNGEGALDKGDEKQDIVDYANKNALLQIKVHSDGDVFEIENQNGNEYLIQICDHITENILKRTV